MINTSEKTIDTAGISGYDRYLFHEGCHFRSYRMFGAHLAVRNGVSGVRFAVWRPKRRKCMWWGISIVGGERATRCSAWTMRVYGNCSCRLWKREWLLQRPHGDGIRYRSMAYSTGNDQGIAVLLKGSGAFVRRLAEASFTPAAVPQPFRCGSLRHGGRLVS